MQHHVSSSSAGETEALGTRLARVLTAGDWIALTGALGSGKTTFLRGVARGLGYREAVRSPTFTLVARYQTRPALIHADLYRVGSEREAEELGIDDLAADEPAVVAVEWADLYPSLIADRGLWVHLQGVGEEREVEFRSSHQAWADRWREVESL